MKNILSFPLFFDIYVIVLLTIQVMLTILCFSFCFSNVPFFCFSNFCFLFLLFLIFLFFYLSIFLFSYSISTNSKMDVDEKQSSSPVPQQKVAAVPSAQPKVIKGNFKKNLNFISISFFLFLVTRMAYSPRSNRVCTLITNFDFLSLHPFFHLFILPISSYLFPFFYPILAF